MMSSLVLGLRFLHSQNAVYPMLVTLSGMLMLVNDLQYSYLLLVDYQYYTL